MLTPHIVYSPRYDIQFMGLEKLHPFDSRKYSRAYNLLHDEFGEKLAAITFKPPRQVSREELLLTHTSDYLDSLQSASVVAQAVELSFVAALPSKLIDRYLLRPMRLATMGTILAAELALEHGLIINLGGGYHHASQSRGEGFCVYSDVGLAIHALREKDLLAADDPVFILDLDVHQGNGHERIFLNDPAVRIMDVYQEGIYPGDALARKAITCEVPLPFGTSESTYLAEVKSHLTRCLDEMPTPKLALYVAGTDIYEADSLGGFRVSEPGIAARDQYVFDTLTARGIPTVMTLGGGYSKESYRFIANAARYVIETWG